MKTLEEANMSLKIRVPFEVTEEEVQKLINVATSRGYLRVDPRKRWTTIEQTEAVRFAIKMLISQRLSSGGEDENA